MIAPDKIHLFFSSDGDYLAFKEKPFEGTVAYIRKEALLEWAKQKQYDSETIVQDDFWQEVIDKLNEM